MKSKMVRLTVALCLALYPLQGFALAAITVDVGVGVGAQGTMTAVKELTVTLRNVSDDSLNVTGLGFNAPAGATVVTSPQYAEIAYNDNRVGDQRIIIRTDNRNTAADPGTDANPLYTGKGTGAGLVGVTDTKIDLPLLWVIYPEKKNPPSGTTAGTGYTFTGNSQFEAFVQDLKSDRADFNNDGTADCDQLVNGNPPTGGACIKFDASYAALVFGLDNQKGLLANFPEDKEPTVDNDNNASTPSQNDGPARDDTSPVFAYFGANYTGKPAQDYRSNTLEIQLVTVTA